MGAGGTYKSQKAAKVCKKCQKVKPLGAFYRTDKTRSKDGRRNPCKDCFRVYLNKLYPDNRKKYHSAWRKRNREKCRTGIKTWRHVNLDKAAFTSYKGNAKGKGLVFKLSFEQFLTLRQQPCYYCGIKLRRVGVDRINNKKGYVKGNVVPCCQICNYMKLTKTVYKFVKQCTLVAKHRGNYNGKSV